MSASPKLDEPKVNNPAGLILRYQANIRLGADFYFPKEFAQLNRLLQGCIEQEGASPISDRDINRAVALFEEIERRYEARVSDCHGLLGGFLSHTLRWLGESEAPVAQLRLLEKARCRLTFGNPGAALREARSVVDEFLAHRLIAVARDHGEGLSQVSTITQRALPLPRLHAFLEKAPATTHQYRVLLLLPQVHLKRMLAMAGASPSQGGENALLLRAVQDRQHVVYLIALNCSDDGWGELLERHPHWDGCYLALPEEEDPLRREIAFIEHLQRLIPHLRGEMVVGMVGEEILKGYPKLARVLAHFAPPKDRGDMESFIHRMIEGRA